MIFRGRWGLALFFFLFAFLFFPSSVQTQPLERSFDYYIQDGLIFDGQSVQGQKVDIGINGSRIAFIGKIKEPRAKHILAAKGLVVTPGFIDAHTHSDFNPLVYPNLANKIEQGVTTEVVGNCGMSAAPVIGAQAKYIHEVWAREGVVIPRKIPWVSFEEYRQALQSKGLETNFVGLIGHGNLRAAVLGYNPRQASESELFEMKKILREAMDQGAFGISFGLSYLPGTYASEKEIMELCLESGRKLGICVFHMRSEGSQLVESIEEVLRIARATRSRIQISHLKAGGRSNWLKMTEAIGLIQAARNEGLAIEADFYPYEAGYAELGAILPDPLYRKPDRNDYFRNRLKRQELLDQLRKYDEDKQLRWDSVMVASVEHPRYQGFEGMTLKGIAQKLKIEPEKFLIDILADTHFEVSAFYFSQNQKVIDQVAAEPWVSLGSDSIADGTRKPHPRCYGTFPKFLQEYVRGQKTVPIGDAVKRMSSLPAQHFGIPDRGRIAVGAYADLVIWDAGDIKDRATYLDPHQGNSGIRWVFLNGKVALTKGKSEMEKLGLVLSSSNNK